MKDSTGPVREYWDSHLNCTQFLTDPRVAVGSAKFYELLDDYIGDRHDYKNRLLEEFAAGPKGQQLLEIGCGLGIELARLGKLGFDVTGIDLSPRAVEIAGSYLRSQQLRGQTLVQNAERLEFSDESFDAIYSSGVIQHTPNITRAISEMIRVLRPGGRILVILYHRHSWFYLLHKLTGVNIEFDDQDAPIINTYTRKGLRSLFAGLRSITVDCEYYYPKRTNRTGSLPFLFNRIFVPGCKIIPRFIMKNFGWHLVLKGIK